MPTSPSTSDRAQAGAAHGAGHHRGRSPQAVGHDRGRRRSRAAARARVGSPPTGPATPRCARTRRPGPSGSGRSRAANGAGRPLAQRLLEAGEQVVDVPAKLAARVRLFDTGHNRKTDARDAHSIAVVAVRTKTLRVLQLDGELEALRMLTDRREALTRRRVQTVDRLQALLAELLPGQAQTRHHHRPGQGDAGHRSGPVTSPGRPAAGSPPRSWPSWSRSRPRSRRPPPSSRRSCSPAAHA